MKKELIEKLAGMRVGMNAAIEFGEVNCPSMGNSFLKDARSSIGRACMYLGSKNPYPNSTEINFIIEDGVDMAEMMNGSQPGLVLSMKSMINACEMYLKEIAEIRIKPLHASNPMAGYLLVRSLDRAIDHLENAIASYLRELRHWKNYNPDEYKEILNSSTESVATAPEDAVKTDSIMQKRAQTE